MPRPRALEVGASLAGLALVVGAVSFDGTDLLSLARVPSGELNNRWVVADLATWRVVCGVVGGLLLLSGVALWKSPQSVERVTDRVGFLVRAASHARLTIPVVLTALVLSKTLLQLCLYSVGYAAYGADDFTRTLSADYWQYHRTLNIAGDAWLGLSGSTWLPFPDYLFGAALFLHRDLFLTPKIVNLLLSGVAVIAVYWLSRELFGRAAGVFAAVLFAFQPWHIWLGMSGMTSDLPSVVLITCFCVYLVRWCRTDDTRSLLAAAAFLGIANGLRYENWFVAIVFSAVVVFVAVSRLRQGRGSLSGAVAALAIVNAFPIAWMVASYVVLGDWLPALHLTNAFMVGASMPEAASEGLVIPLPVNQSPSMAQINMAVLAIGSFPFELALSILGIVWLFRSDANRPLRPYVALLGGTVLLFVIVFKGRLPASLVFARYFLAFVVLSLPFAGLLLVRLTEVRGVWRQYARVTACLVLVAVGTLDVGRAFNYPDIFPQDAIAVGWTIRKLQESGSLPADGKILIERRQDWGDLGIVALANKPERFVALNEFGNPAARKGQPIENDVRGTLCDRGFQVEACKDSVRRQGFNLVILSSPMRIASFEEAFERASWRVGPYHVFDLGSAPAQPRQP